MEISFIGVLTKPLKLKNFIILLLNSVLLFLPSIIANFFLGPENIVYKIVLSISSLIAFGYMWDLFQAEIENENAEFPKWSFISNFCTGIKGVLFTLVSFALLATGLFILALAGYYLPFVKLFVVIIAILFCAYWLFVHYPISMGMFAQEYNPAKALNLSTVFEVACSCWTNYTIGAAYTIAYAAIISLTCLACLVLFDYNQNILIIGFFSIYGMIVYSLLYANIFKQVRSEFESYL